MSQSPPPSKPTEAEIFPGIIKELQERIATLERNGGDIDTDFANADKLFSHFEARVSDLEHRMDQLSPRLIHCSNCHRVLRTVDRVCEFCNARN